MTNILSKCGICCSEVEEISHHHPLQPIKILGAQLNVIFILKHIYELKSDDLESYLQKWGNPGDWLKLCPNCEDDISNVRGIFEKLHQISRELEKAKLEIQVKIKSSEWKKVFHRARKEAGPGVEEVLNECRRTICNRRRRRKPLLLLNPFVEGDLKASKLALKQEVNVKEENNELEDVAYPEFNFYGENTSPEEHDFEFGSTCDHSASDDDDAGHLKEPAISLPSQVRKSRRPLKKVKYSEDCSDEEDEEETGPTTDGNCSKVTPTRTESQVPEPNATAQSEKCQTKRMIKCPVCKANFVVLLGNRFTTFSRHLQACVSSLKETEISHVDLKCSSCKKFCCGTSEIGEFMEHILLCGRRNKGDQRFPWRDALIKCNLCEGEYSFYIPYPDYIQHIFKYHQHRYGCTQCPFRCRTSQDLGTRHWNTHHKNMLHVPASERYKIDTEKVTLPYIPWWCPGPDCLQEFSDEASRDDHLKTCPKQNQLPQRSQSCSFCDRKYFFEEELLMHRVSVHGYLKVANAYECQECDTTFVNSRQLRDHQRRKHRINLISCDKCDQKFAHSDEILEHVRLVHGHKNEEERKEFTCLHCGKVFGLKFKLRLHIRKAHENLRIPRVRKRPIVKKSYGRKRSTSIHLCSFCGRSFFYARSLSLHTKVCRLPQFRCIYCKLRFATKELLNDHKVEVHHIKCRTLREDGEKPRKRRMLREFDLSMVTLSEDKTSGLCNICKKKYDTIKKLKLHVTLSHLSSCTCESCGKVLRNQICLRSHKKICFPGKGAPPSASKPAKVLKSVKAPKSAKVPKVPKKSAKEPKKSAKVPKMQAKVPKKSRKATTSTTDRNTKVICDLCGLEIKSYCLKQHVLNVHENEKNLPVACDICGKRFPYKSHMLQHKSIVHEIGDFKCDVEGCSKVFWKAELLEKHKKYKHEGVGNHFCQFCGKGFPSKPLVKHHEQAMHTNKDSKPFKCELCEKTFATTKYRNYHVKHTHKLSNMEKLKLKCVMNK